MTYCVMYIRLVNVIRRRGLRLTSGVMGSTTVSHLPRCPGGKVLDDDAVIGLPAGRVASADGAATSTAAGWGSSEAPSSASTSALAGQFHANPVCNDVKVS